MRKMYLFYKPTNQLKLYLEKTFNALKHEEIILEEIN